MKTTIILFLLILSNLVIAKEQDEKNCLQQYKDSFAKKEKRYSKARKKYHANRNRAVSTQFSNDFSTRLLGSAYLQNSSAPSRSDYDMFEGDIINAAEADLSKYISLKPTVLEGIYNAAYEKYADITYEKIQALMKKGFEENRFCTFFGKKRVPSIKRYVLKELKKESKDSILTRDPAVINFNEDAGAKSYSVEDENEEINKPLENKGILE